MAPKVKRNVSPRIYICFLAEWFVIRLNSFANLFTVFVFSSKSFVPNTFKNLKEWEVTRERAPDTRGCDEFTSFETFKRAML